MWEVFRVSFRKQSSVFDLVLEQFSFKLPTPFRLCWLGMLACIMTATNRDNETGEVMRMSLESVPFTHSFHGHFSLIVYTQCEKCSANYRKARKPLWQKLIPRWRISKTGDGLKKKSRDMWLTCKKDCVSREVVCIGDLIYIINQPGQALCAWCHEIIRYGSKGKIAHHHRSQENFPRTSLCPRKSLIIIMPNIVIFSAELFQADMCDLFKPVKVSFSFIFIPCVYLLLILLKLHFHGPYLKQAVKLLICYSLPPEWHFQWFFCFFSK